MNVIEEIQEVVEEYKKQGKGIDHIKVNQYLLDQAVESMGSLEKKNVYDEKVTLLGYPYETTNNEYLRFMVQSK